MNAYRATQLIIVLFHLGHRWVPHWVPWVEDASLGGVSWCWSRGEWRRG